MYNYEKLSPNFLGWVDLITHGAPQARLARQSSSNNDFESQVKSTLKVMERARVTCYCV